MKQEVIISVFMSEMSSFLSILKTNLLRAQYPLVFLILAILLVVSGAEQCPQGGIGGIGGGGKTQAVSYGVDFDMQTGIDKLSAGKTLLLGDTFFADILIENFDSEAKSGTVCIRDNIDDAYGGLQDSCKAFQIQAASYLGDTLESPASISVTFPEGGNYAKYTGFPIDTDAKLYVTISYSQHSVYSAAIKAPLPEKETVTVQGKPSPIKISIEKTISGREEGSKANLKIGFTKQGTYNISSADFKKEGFAFSTNFGQYTLSCSSIEGGFIEFKNTKFISCSASLPREQITHPLLITLDYGVRLSKEYSFKIQKEAK